MKTRTRNTIAVMSSVKQNLVKVDGVWTIDGYVTFSFHLPLLRCMSLYPKTVRRHLMRLRMTAAKSDFSKSSA